MKYVLVSVLLGVLIKDTSYLGDSYILRGATQVAALFAGGYWMLTLGPAANLKKYFWFFLLLGVIGLSSLVSRDPIFSAFQFLSLLAVSVAFIAYSESRASHREDRDVAIKTTVIAGSIICTLSLLLIKIKPDYAYLYDEFEKINRFRGLFGQPAAMGAMAGLVLGTTLFWKQRWFIKAPIIAIAMTCLMLTSARTFWVAAIVGLAVTAWWMFKSKSGLIMIGSLLLVVMLVIFTKAFDVLPSTKAANAVLRTDSIESMSGRTNVWAYAFKRFLDKPLLGYGFTTGDSAFIPDASDSSVKYLIKRTRYTLHNGYIQALLDSGIFGALLYIGVVLKALVGFYKSNLRTMAAPFYALLFLAIANLGESVMFSAATFSSLLAWYLVIFGLSLGGKRRDEKKSAPPPAPNTSLYEVRFGKKAYA